MREIYPGPKFPGTSGYVSPVDLKQFMGLISFWDSVPEQIHQSLFVIAEL
jgi:hypothetical protein